MRTCDVGLADVAPNGDNARAMSDVTNYAGRILCGIMCVKGSGYRGNQERGEADQSEYATRAYLFHRAYVHFQIICT